MIVRVSILEHAMLSYNVKEGINFIKNSHTCYLGKFALAPPIIHEIYEILYQEDVLK